MTLTSGRWAFRVERRLHAGVGGGDQLLQRHAPVDVPGADVVAEVLGLLGRQDRENRVRPVGCHRLDHDVPLPAHLADRDDPRATLGSDVALDRDAEIAAGDGVRNGCHRFRSGDGVHVTFSCEGNPCGWPGSGAIAEYETCNITV